MNPVYESVQRGLRDGRSTRQGRRWILFAMLAAIGSMPSVAAGAQDWVSRTVTAVGGTFTDISPAFGYESGLGTSRLDWGDPLPGSFTSYLQFNGYDAFPGFDQPWFYGGQTVAPGQRFLAGTMEFRNGSVQTYSSSMYENISMQISVFGSELSIDNHPLSLSDKWTITVVQTPNQGVDPKADADYFYFTNFPNLGSFHVLEGATASVEIYGKFGSIDPAGFGAVSDPSLGFVTTPVPEPSGFVSLVSGLGLAGWIYRRQKRVAASPRRP